MTGTPKVITVYVARYVQDCMSCPFLYDDDYVRSCGHDNAPKDYNQCRILYSQNLNELTDSCLLVQNENKR